MFYMCAGKRKVFFFSICKNIRISLSFVRWFFVFFLYEMNFFLRIRLCVVRDRNPKENLRIVCVSVYVCVCKKHIHIYATRARDLIEASARAKNALWACARVWLAKDDFFFVRFHRAYNLKSFAQKGCYYFILLRILCMFDYILCVCVCVRL